MLRDESDYDSYFEDTMRAGHYENRKESVDIMIRSSRDVINDLLNFGVRFAKNPDGSLAYTREELIPGRGSASMRILPERRSQRHYYHM